MWSYRQVLLGRREPGKSGFTYTSLEQLEHGPYAGNGLTPEEKEARKKEMAAHRRECRAKAKSLRAGELCPSCIKAAEEKAAAEADAAEDQRRGLPTLATGSPKQIAWAKTIRRQYFDLMADCPQPFVDWLRSHRDAEWWIDKRRWTTDDFRRRFRDREKYEGFGACRIASID